MKVYCQISFLERTFSPGGVQLVDSLPFALLLPIVWAETLLHLHHSPMLSLPSFVSSLSFHRYICVTAESFLAQFCFLLLYLS